MSNLDTTRVIGGPGTPAAPEDRTMVVPGGAGATLQAPAAGDAFRTQMGGTTTCPVCKSTTPLMETYCGECGFLLTSTPAEEIALPVEEAPPAELVDLTDGRRYRLRAGVNTVGRQGTDILSADGTVSRNHAKITVEGDKVTIEDLGSSNGTKVGDQRIGLNQPTVAAPGTPLKFGNWQLRLEAGGAAGATAGSAEQTIAIADTDRTMVGQSGGDQNQVEQPTSAPAVPPLTTETESPAIAGPLVAILNKIEGPAADIPIYDGTIAVGRRPNNTIALPQDAYISGRHAEINTDDTGTYLIDLGSTNGTFVNGQKLVPNERQLLLEGDEIQLGQSKYRFVPAPPVEETPTDLETATDETAPASSGTLDAVPETNAE